MHGGALDQILRHTQEKEVRGTQGVGEWQRLSLFWLKCNVTSFFPFLLHIPSISNQPSLGSPVGRTGTGNGGEGRGFPNDNKGNSVWREMEKEALETGAPCRLDCFWFCTWKPQGEKGVKDTYLPRYRGEVRPHNKAIYQHALPCRLPVASIRHLYPPYI